MEKTSRRSILGTHQSSFWESVGILSNSIECHHPERNTSSLLHCESCQDGNWRSHTRKGYMSTRPPTKISLKHEMEKRIGFRTCSTTRSWATVKVIKELPIEPTNPNPSLERTERPVVKDDTRTVQDGRKTSHCQNININYFHWETVYSERTEIIVIETSVIQTRSSEDSKDTNVETAHDRTKRLVVETNSENVQHGCQTRSCRESETFNVGDKTLRERTERPVVNHDDSSHEQTMLNEVNMDFRIPGLNIVVKHTQSTSVRELIQKNWEPPWSTRSSTNPLWKR